MTEARRMKWHYTVKDPTTGYLCLLCGLGGDIRDIRACKCVPNDDVPMPDAETAAERAANSMKESDDDDFASDLQLMEYLSALEAEESDLQKLWMLQQLEEEEQLLAQLVHDRDMLLQEEGLAEQNAQACKQPAEPEPILITPPAADIDRRTAMEVIGTRSVSLSIGSPSEDEHHVHDIKPIYRITPRELCFGFSVAILYVCVCVRV